MARDGLREPPPITPPARIIAEGIATVAPLRATAFLEAVAESGGEVVPVPETAIAAALARLGRAGLFVEPTSATVLPALDQLGRAHGGPLPGVTVLVLTGSGLKAAGAVAELLQA